MNKSEALNFVNILKQTYPDAQCSLDFNTPFQLAVAVMLSAQCTDERVNKTTPILFKKCKTIDDFKNINDTYGHLYGDTVIAMVAEMLNKATDDDAIVGRYGGDEFFVFLKSNRIAENADRVVDNVCKINISDDKRITCLSLIHI